MTSRSTQALEGLRGPETALLRQSSDRYPLTDGATEAEAKNRKAYNEALKARCSLPTWLDQSVKRHRELTPWGIGCRLTQSTQWLAAPSGQRGRSPTFSDTAIQFCLSIKCLFGQPLRQPLGMVKLAQLA